MAGAIVSEPQKDFSTLESHIHVLCDVPTAISINFQDTMDAMVYHCYVVTSTSSNFEDALDATFQQPFQSTSSTLWMLHPFRATWKTLRMLRSNSHLNKLPGHYGCYGLPLLRCNIHFEQLRRRFGCFLPRAISINFQDTMDARL